VSPRPTIFISAVSREQRSARQLVANTLTFLGYQPIWQEIFGEEGKNAEAEADFRELINLEEKAVGPENPDTLFARNGLAVVLAQEAKYGEAEAQFREVIKLYEKVEGPEQPDTLDCYYYFAPGLKGQHKVQEAREFARRAAEGARKVLGPEHPSTRKYEKLWGDLEKKH